MNNKRHALIMAIRELSKRFNDHRKYLEYLTGDGRVTEAPVLSLEDKHHLDVLFAKHMEAKEE